MYIYLINFYNYFWKIILNSKEIDEEHFFKNDYWVNGNNE